MEITENYKIPLSLNASSSSLKLFFQAEPAALAVGE